MNSTAFSLSSKSNSKIDENQIAFGAKDFQPHPPTLAPIFANLDREVDLTIRSFNFHVGSLGSVRLSDPINSVPMAGKAMAAATSETSVGSSSEINSPVSFKPTIGSTVEEFGNLMENLDLGESLGSADMGSDGNFDEIHNHLEGDFMGCDGNVPSTSEDEWRARLKLHNDKHMSPSSASDDYTSNRHQIYVIMNNTSEEFDVENNPIINPQNPARGAHHRAEGETKSAVEAREKIRLSAEEWQMIKVALNHSAVIPANSAQEVLIGYQYALHQ
jgi:hypothetical protein